MPKTAWMGLGAASAGVAFAATLIARWGGPGVALNVSQYGCLAFSLFAVVCSGLAARSAVGRQRKAWIAMLVGLTGWTIGAALWIYYESIAHQPPFPSLADAGYLTFPIGAAAAMVLFPVGYPGHSRARFVLDGLIVAGALFEISWVLVLRSIFE